jgi:hypothetical protein
MVADALEQAQDFSEDHVRFKLTENLWPCMLEMTLRYVSWPPVV